MKRVLLLFLLLSFPLFGEDKKPAELRVKINFSQCQEAIWTNMPGGMSALVEREGEATTQECAAAALQQARSALNDSKMVAALGKAASITVDLLSKVTGLGLAKSAAASVVSAYL